MSDWHEKWAVGGKRALKRTGQPGRPPKVNEADLAKVARALQKGPKANGFPTDLWTLARVADVIEKVTGVKYHPGHVWRVLRQMGWSSPASGPSGRRAGRRGDRAVGQRTLAQGKKNARARGAGSSSRTRAGSASSPR